MKRQSFPFSSAQFDYSDAVTKYVSVFPERSGAYVVQLIPENLYNQISLLSAVGNSFGLLILYFSLLAMDIFLFSIIGKKMLGLFFDGMIIIAGTITCAGRSNLMWWFPMAHTIPWLHYTKYSSEPIIHLSRSFIVLLAVNVVLVMVSLVLTKYYKKV